MKRVTLATIAISALAGSLLQTPVQASPPTPGPTGRGCSYSASSDPSPEAGDDAMTGQINAGPMQGETGGTLYCTIRINNNSHTGAYAATLACPADSNGIIICGEPINYTSGEDDQDYLCMSYRKPNGDWIYRHPTDDKGTLDPGDDEPGHWTPDPTKPCSAAFQFSLGPIFTTIFDIIDPIICDILKGYAGPGPDNAYLIDKEGDVFIDFNGDGQIQDDEIFWDCPKYTFPGTPTNNPDYNDGGTIDWP